MYIILTFWDSNIDRLELETCSTITSAKERADVIVASEQHDAACLLPVYDESGELMLSYDKEEGFMVSMAGVRAFRAEDTAFRG